MLPADAPNASVAVMLMRSRATGVLQGLGSGRALIRYVSNQEVVQAGEAVLTSGLDRVFPRGLLVGYAGRGGQGDLELRVLVHLSAPLDRVNAVLVLPPSRRWKFNRPSWRRSRNRSSGSGVRHEARGPHPHPSEPGLRRHAGPRRA